MADEYIYRVTRRRRNPRYYQSKVQTKLHSKRSLSGILRSIRERYAHYEQYKDRYNLTEPAETIVRIERSRLGPFEDVTSEYLTPEEAAYGQDHGQDS